MPLGPVQKAAIERHISGVFDNSPFLQSIPMARWVVYRSCNITMTQQHPSLLESLSRLGLYLTAVGFSVSLLNYMIIPTVCCGAVMMIFRSTIIELRKQAIMNNQIQRLETANTRLETSLAQQRTLVTQLQDTLNTAQITTENIRELKTREQEALAACERAQTRLEAVTELLDTRLAAHTANFSRIEQSLTTQVNRLGGLES